MTYQICIKCKEWEEPSTFKFQYFCEKCGKNNSIDELARYEDVFNWELLFLEKPSVDCYKHKLGHNNRSRGDLFRIGKEKIENLIVNRDERKKTLENINDTSSYYNRIVTDINQLQEQFARILYYKPKN